MLNYGIHLWTSKPQIEDEKKTDKQMNNNKKQLQNGAIFCDWVYFVLLKRRDFYFWGLSTQNCIHFCAH